ncbi:MAG: hypothetical protein WC989_04420 [Micavibrio sp.]
MEKPGVFEITKQSVDLFKENKDLFRRRIAALLPFALILIGAAQAGAITGQFWLQLCALVPMIYLQSFFSLAWFRLALHGRDGGEGFSFLKPAKADWAFIFSFTGLALAPALPALLFMAAIFFLRGQGVSADFAAYLPFIRIVMALFFIAALQMIFLLPARAAGAGISLAALWRLSRGLRLKMAGGFLIFLLLLILAFYIYSGLIGVVALTVGEAAMPEGWGLTFIATVLAAPVFIGVLAFIALVSGMIARAYEWALANRPVQG